MIRIVWSWFPAFGQQDPSASTRFVLAAIEIFSKRARHLRKSERNPITIRLKAAYSISYQFDGMKKMQILNRSIVIIDSCFTRFASSNQSKLFRSETIIEF